MVRTPYCDKNGMKKGTWTPEEDMKLIAYITTHGYKNWRQLPKLAGLARCGKSCRLRWMNYLRPGIKRGNFTAEEEETIIKLHATLGNRWSVIASHLPGRSDNEIKNHWHAHLKKHFKHNSVTTEKAEASNSNHHSPVEISIQENNYSVEVAATASPYHNSSIATYSHASPSSTQLTSLSDFLCLISEPEPASDGNLLDDFADFVVENTDPISKYSWKELYDISYLGEFLVPFVAEPESFCPGYDVWGLLE